jgi:hypothetical protein
MNADGILPNPIGDPPTTNPEPNLIGSFGFYKHEAATLLNELALRLPEFRFEGYWTSSPFFKDPVPMELLQRAIDEAPSNCQHFVGPLSEENCTRDCLVVQRSLSGTHRMQLTEKCLQGSHCC